MGVKIWLPVGKAPQRKPQNEREELKQRLYEARYLVPDADHLDIEQLRDIVAYAEEKKRKQDEDDELKRQAAAQMLTNMNPEQRRGALHEFHKWRKRRQQAAGQRPK